MSRDLCYVLENQHIDLCYVLENLEVKPYFFLSQILEKKFAHHISFLSSFMIIKLIIINLLHITPPH